MRKPNEHVENHATPMALDPHPRLELSLSLVFFFFSSGALLARGRARRSSAIMRLVRGHLLGAWVRLFDISMFTCDLYRPHRAHLLGGSACSLSSCSPVISIDLIMLTAWMVRLFAIIMYTCALHRPHHVHLLGGLYSCRTWCSCSSLT